MTTKHRFRSRFALQLRERDHARAHVHLYGAGFDVMINLATLESTGQWPPGIKADVMEWIATHHNDLMEEWKKWHK
jgi:hypothetical protein